MKSLISGIISSLTFLTVLSPGCAEAQQSQRSVSDVVKTAINSVVVVIVNDASGEPWKLGSGFVASDGEIVTNHHVIAGAGSAVVKLTNGTVLMVEGVVADDANQDIAIIKVSGRTPPALPLANSNTLSIGDHVVAIGSPSGLENTVSDGIISGFRTDPEGSQWLQTTTPISHGSSGGPLLTMNGKVVGITTMGSSEGNLNFAAPSKIISAMLVTSVGSVSGPFPPAPKAKPVETPPVAPKVEPPKTNYWTADLFGGVYAIETGKDWVGDDYIRIATLKPPSDTVLDRYNFMKTEFVSYNKVVLDKKNGDYLASLLTFGFNRPDKKNGAANLCYTKGEIDLRVESDSRISGTIFVPTDVNLATCAASRFIQVPITFVPK